MKGLNVLLIVITLTAMANGDVFRYSYSVDLGIPQYQTADCSSLVSNLELIPGHTEPVRIVKLRVPSPQPITPPDITVRISDSVSSYCNPGEFESPIDVTTSSESEYEPASIAIDTRVVWSHPETSILESTTAGEETIVTLAFCPIVPSADDCSVWIATKLDIELRYSADPSTTHEDIESSAAFLTGVNLDAVNPTGWVNPGPLPTARAAAGPGDGYLIITSSQLQTSFVPLQIWKSQLGYNTTIVTTDEINAQYNGADLQQRIRSCLADAFGNGVRWVLLGGDENVIPIRYAYHRDTDSSVDLENMQICDLYYADLTGDWDSDGDGIFGEPTSDNADKTPELNVGRALVNTPAEAGNFVTKSIEYEQHLDADSDFPIRILTASSDQMRDYRTVGQDYLIAEQLPTHLDIDFTTLAENQSGSDPSPASPSAPDLVAKLSEGFNLTYIFAHGTTDGFISMSASYNQWPKSYVWTWDEVTGDHGTLDDLTNYGNCGIVYSIGCKNAAFDQDKPPYSNHNPCIAEKLLCDSLTGAVAFIGYTRWGWVASSYSLAMDFNEYLYDIDNQLGPANDYSKAQNSHLTDLVYGLNVYGDPSLRIWTDVPESLDLDIPSSIESGENEFSIVVSASGQPLESAIVVVTQDTTTLFGGLTATDGTVQVAFDMGLDSSAMLTVSKPGYIPAQAELSTSIVLDADDDDAPVRPEEFSLDQNFPNPFNPSTTISFYLPCASQTNLTVYNILGQTVCTPLDDYLDSGKHSVVIDAEGWPSGLYFYRLTSSSHLKVRKMALVK
jgi:hypothetical protein